MKEVETEAFSQNVKTRYRSDIIMSAPVTLLVLILPLIVAGVFLLSVRLGQLTRLEDFKSAWLLLLLTLQLYVMAIVMFIMYSRLHKHAKRDREWRGALLTFAKEQHVDTSRLEDLHKHISFREAFALSSLIVLFMAVMFVWDYNTGCNAKVYEDEWYITEYGQSDGEAVCEFVTKLVADEVYRW